MHSLSSMWSPVKVGVSLLFASASFLSGCTRSLTSAADTASSATPVSVAGNWQISSTTAAAVRLPELSGSLSGSSQAITGVVHSDSANACLSSTTPIQLSGSANGDNLVTLTGQNVAGGTLNISGTLAFDGKSLSAVTYRVVGGACAFAQPAVATAQEYSPVSGNYTGTFSDADGVLINIQANLRQSADADGDGNYTLNGTATLPNNPCFPNIIPISNTLVTGGSFTFTFTTNDDSNSVTANGTFNNNASLLSVISWTSSGSCGADNGTGSMMQ